MRLAALLAAADLEGQSSISWPGEGARNSEVVRVSHDSRRVVSGDLFCCIPGGTHDGHR